MSNIFVNLPLPVNAVVKVAVYRPLADKAARHIEEAEMAREVARAVQAWYYETYC